MVKYLFLSLFGLFFTLIGPALGAEWTALPSGLSYRDDVVGPGAEVVSGALVTVHYRGTFPDGRLFDASHAGDRPPFRFVEETTYLLPGWTEGVKGMRVGGKRTLNLPPALAYGAVGVKGVIPGGAVLLYEVEVVSVEPPPAAPPASN